DNWLSEWIWKYKASNYVLGSIQHFTIDLGNYVAPGLYRYLSFINYDGEGQGNSYFSNVKLAEKADPPAVTFTEGSASNVHSYNGAWDLDPTSWQVQDNGNTLYLYNGARKGVDVNYEVTKNTILEFDFKAVGTLGDVYGIGLSNNINALT